jgi:hypothetical protein
MTDSECAALVAGDRIGLPDSGIYAVISNDTASKKITVALIRQVAPGSMSYEDMSDSVKVAR